LTWPRISASGILDLALCRRECILDRDHDVLVFARASARFRPSPVRRGDLRT
jgi:hypothetical protein